MNRVEADQELIRTVIHYAAELNKQLLNNFYKHFIKHNKHF